MNQASTQKGHSSLSFSQFGREFDPYRLTQEVIEAGEEWAEQDAAASALDAMNMNVVLGTLAGDDTAVVIMRDTNAAAAFCGEIKSLIGG